MPKRIERAATSRADLGRRSRRPSRSGEGLSILDPEERERDLAYGVFTAAATRALRQTMRRGVASLPRITAPTLMIQSREDNRITAGDAERAFARIGSRDKTLEWITGAAHVITVDFGRDTVIAQLAAFMEMHARAARGDHTSVRS